MAAVKNEIARALESLVSDKTDEIMDRADDLRRRFDLDDDEMRDVLGAWNINLRDAWVDYCEDGT